MVKEENDKIIKTKISLDETLERFNEKKFKEITITDLQHEIANIKIEIIELKNYLKNIKNDNLDLKQEVLLLKIDKHLDNEHSNSEHDDEYRDKGPKNGYWAMGCVRGH